MPALLSLAGEEGLTVPMVEVLGDDSGRGAWCGPGLDGPRQLPGVVHLHLLAPLREMHHWLEISIQSERRATSAERKGK
jgi:hypothetical protein